MANRNKYSVEEKLAWCFKSWAGESLRNIVAHFAAEFPERPIPSTSTVRNAIRNLDKTGCVNGPEQHSRPTRQLSDDKMLAIMLCFEEDPQTSTRKVALRLDVAQSTVLKVLHKFKMHPYKRHVQHSLMPGDDELRMAFCETMMERIHLEPDLCRRVCFSDEATIQLYATPNRQNVRIWSVNNLYESVDIRTQYPQKLNVWVGIYRGRVIGPKIIEGNLNGVKYIRLLREKVIPELRALEGNVIMLNKNEIDRSCY